MNSVVGVHDIREPTATNAEFSLCTHVVQHLINGTGEQCTSKEGRNLILLLLEVVPHLSDSFFLMQIFAPASS